MNDKHIGVNEIFNIYKKYIKNILSITFVAFSLSIIYSIFATPLYKSYISIYPQNNENTLMPPSMIGVESLVSTLGFNVPGNIANGFNIPDILNSRKLKKAIVLEEWGSKNNNKVNLIQSWKIDKPGILSFIFKKNNISEEYFQNIAIEKLTSRMTVYQHESGMITISILMEDEIIAANIVNFISDWIQNYISKEMTFKAIKDRKFIEEQLNKAKDDLFLSEERFSEFQRNYSIADGNPEVMLQKGRLIRNIEVNQQVYIILRQQYELNKIEELKERPVINVLDVGDIATEKSRPLRMLIIFGASLITFILSGFLMYCYDGIYRDIH